ncbi:GNAT family N-acetyltransferase [Halobacillus salinus]|uniref:GNAT family N-acetyltransferase n=1 Tax=Halobacillus salinus TaxID=192814 RepID=UPI0009A7D1F6|nr:GNAT family N-acetyltransferase [Halobacillus salinus]
MHIKTMIDCSIQDALTAMNEGFQDYSVDIQMTTETFIETMASKKLSPEYSLVAFDGEKPVGIVLNSIYMVDGKKTSYNGGTAVHPDYRGKGVGRQLVQKSVDLFEEKEVEVSVLEAISDNDGAISLYESYGYKVDDNLATLRMMFPAGGEASYTVELISLNEWRKLGVTEEPVPWQNKISFVDNREIYAIKDAAKTRGYLVLSQQPNQILTVFQLQAVDDEVTYEQLLASVERRFAGYKVVFFNVPHRHPVYETYRSREVQKVIEQVWMSRVFE